MAYVTPSIKQNDLKLLRIIGKGGFSTVYEATWRHSKGEQQVAAKKLHKINKEELDILSQLNHPNIVKLLGVVDENFEFMLVMELCQGSLRSYLDKTKGTKLSINHFIDWAKQAARAIKYLKEKKVVHKDVKSPNYLIAEDNVLKLGDFGTAKIMEITVSNATSTASYAWMAPELLKDQKLSPSYDIFSYGVVVWELWTTDVPFEGCELPNIMWRVCINNERPPIPPDCPKPIADLMRQCWETDWHKRPSIDEILNKLDSAGSLTQQQILDGPWVLEKEFGQHGSDKLSGAWGIVVGPNGDIAIADGDTAQLDSAGPLTQQQILDGPWVLEKEFGQHGSHKLFDAWGIAVNPNRDIAVADRVAAQVKVYSSEGEYKLNLDTAQGLNPGIKSYPHAVTVNSEGNYYVTDTTHVKVFDATGVYKGKWVAISPDGIPSDTGCHSLWGLAMDNKGQLLVGVIIYQYISKHRQDGSHITSIKVEIHPHYLAVTSQDTIIVCDMFTTQIIDDTGQVLHTLKPSIDVTHWTPRGVCCHADTIFICNFAEGSGGIYCFSVAGEYLGKITVEAAPHCLTFIKETDKLMVSFGGKVQIYCRKN